VDHSRSVLFAQCKAFVKTSFSTNVFLEFLFVIQLIVVNQWCTARGPEGVVIDLEKNVVAREA